ncbi:hypothetical protein DZC72_07200 [Maribacter algicola]|uniref:Uncharacterized protein n=1 Tax=Maribacter algicola TaxID=2498892 RepID=A0A3R8R287_9FLAO|nr:hypothetical protein [Maribacter algicola]RRQ50332.1 hypothetical protein DZC72_07200 [Maribacter algicola]
MVVKGAGQSAPFFYQFFVDQYQFIQTSGVFLRHLKGVPNPIKEEAEIIPNEPGQVMLPRDGNRHIRIIKVLSWTKIHV